MDYEIREAETDDLEGLLGLYAIMSGEPADAHDSRAEQTLSDMKSRGFVHVLVAVCGQTVASTVTVTVIPSLTHGLRPYAVVEHVVTHPDYRGNGMASALLKKAEATASASDCYKLMLITGRKEENVHRLYIGAGYSAFGKTAYVKRLD